MSQGKDIVRFCKDSGIETNRIFYCQFNQAFNLPFNFQTTSLPVEIKQNHVKQISYFRLAALPPYKLHIIKSSTYNGEMNILPTENEKYKMFIMNAQQFLELKESNKVDLFMYIRLFLKNVKSHNVAVWKYVWMPEIMDKGAWSIREFKSFLNKDMYCHDSINISYRQFLPGALIIEPDHKDLVITPPFIVGIMNMTLEQVTEGCPLYARVIDVNALRVLEL